MKESRKEFIKKVHSAASNEWKKNIEKEFPKLFKEDDLKVGKWYKYPDFENWKLLITDNTKGKEKGVGFNCSEIWMKDWLTDGGNELSSLIPCSDEEVKEALIKEAKRRGFKEGVRVDKLLYTNIGSLNGDSKTCENKEFKLSFGHLFIGNLLIFHNTGKWAEIVETITKEQAEKELGKTILN
jgi:hypothetical protein